MATDIVIQLRELASSMKRGNGMSTVYGAADEIERLRYECKEWFLVAREMRDVILGQGDTHAALDDYLRVRGRLADPRKPIKDVNNATDQPCTP